MGELPDLSNIINDFKVIRVVKVIKGFKGGRRGGHKSGRTGVLFILFNSLNGVKAIRGVKDFLVGGRYEFSRLSEVAVWGRCKYGMDLHEIRRKFPKKCSAAVRKYYFKLIRT